MEILLKESKAVDTGKLRFCRRTKHCFIFFCLFPFFSSVGFSKMKIVLFCSIGCHFTFVNAVNSEVFVDPNPITLQVNVVFPIRQVGKLFKKDSLLCIALEWIFFFCCQKGMFKNLLCWQHCNIKPFPSYFSKSVLWFIPVAELQQILFMWNVTEKWLQYISSKRQDEHLQTS